MFQINSDLVLDDIVLTTFHIYLCYSEMSFQKPSGRNRFILGGDQIVKWRQGKLDQVQTWRVIWFKEVETNPTNPSFSSMLGG